MAYLTYLFDKLVSISITANDAERLTSLLLNKEILATEFLLTNRTKQETIILNSIAMVIKKQLIEVRLRIATVSLRRNVKNYA